MKPDEVYENEERRMIAGGDRKAFERLFREWYVRLCIYADTLVHDRDLAEDLVQNVFCVLWEKQKDLKIRESYSSYLYRSVYHAALNSLKHEKVKSAFLEFIRKEEAKGGGDEYDFDKQNQLEILAEIDRAIAALPDQCREIFTLSRFHEKKSAEIASLLGLSVRTVETQLYRAMKRLREELSHLRNGEILFLFFFKSCK